MAVLQIIIRPLYSLSNRKRVEAEMDEDSRIWRDMLIESVPIDQLKTCWQIACQKQTSSFAPNFFDVKNVWLEIEAQQKTESAKIETESRAINRALHCADKAHHRSDTEAMQEYRMPNGSYRWLPCATCRYEAHWQRVKQIKLESEKDASPESVVSEMPEFQDLVRNIRLVK